MICFVRFNSTFNRGVSLIYFNQEWEQINGFETDLVKVLYYDFDSGYSDQYNTYSQYRICTIIEGQKNIEFNNQNFIYDENEYLLLAPNSKIDMKMPIKTRALVLELSDYLIESVNKKVFFNRDIKSNLDPELLMHCQMGDYLKHTINTIKKTSNMGGDDRKFFVDLAAQKLTYNLLKEEHSYRFLTNKISSNVMKQVPEIVNKTCFANISVGFIASELNMSVSNFSNCFKKYYGITPTKYITSCKIKKAKELLEKKSVGEVSFQLGFSNTSYFIEIFKKYCKITPKQYQLSTVTTQNF